MNSKERKHRRRKKGIGKSSREEWDKRIHNANLQIAKQENVIGTD